MADDDGVSPKDGYSLLVADAAALVRDADAAATRERVPVADGVTPLDRVAVADKGPGDAASRERDADAAATRERVPVADIDAPLDFDAVADTELGDRAGRERDADATGMRDCESDAPPPPPPPVVLVADAVADDDGSEDGAPGGDVDVLDAVDELVADDEIV